MSLMFPRLARNFIKNGYFPTDEETLSRVLNHLVPANSGRIRIFDPCAGEGVALAECQHHLGKERVHSFAIEYDKERAWHSKSMLDTVIHGDFQNCVISRKSFGLLFHNPPYGDLVRDRAMIQREAGKGKERLEKIFYHQSYSTLQFGGILVFIIPYTCIDAELAGWISTHFTNVRAYSAPEQKFKQIVIFGERKRVTEKATNMFEETGKSVKELLINIGKGDLPNTIPVIPECEPYVIPAVNSNDIKFVYGGMDIEQLKDEISKQKGTLWSQFDLLFGRVTLPDRAPLCDPSKWHLALELAAGQISGIIESKGRILIVKGNTHKDKTKKTMYEEQEDGSMAEVRVLTDRFVPVIRAIDVTPGSETFGELFVIK